MGVIFSISRRTFLGTPRTGTFAGYLPFDRPLPTALCSTWHATHKNRVYRGKNGYFMPFYTTKAADLTVFAE
jgi:hypothetical protein